MGGDFDSSPGANSGCRPLGDGVERGRVWRMVRESAW